MDACMNALKMHMCPKLFNVHLSIARLICIPRYVYPHEWKMPITFISRLTQQVLFLDLHFFAISYNIMLTRIISILTFRYPYKPQMLTFGTTPSGHEAHNRLIAQELKCYNLPQDDETRFHS
uniref:Uncharacterized protein n=1 Tax=Glossina pallidipes TaxID=7398 RepID=A0A1A9ZNW1_GLOPL